MAAIDVSKTAGGVFEITSATYGLIHAVTVHIKAKDEYVSLSDSHGVFICGSADPTDFTVDGVPANDVQDCVDKLQAYGVQ